MPFSSRNYLEVDPEFSLPATPGRTPVRERGSRRRLNIFGVNWSMKLLRFAAPGVLPRAYGATHFAVVAFGVVLPLLTAILQPR
jgi:hypothetical protein